MNKKLFTQIRNEWRSNLWLALELLLVSVVMWYIIDLLYCRMATYLEPRGFDTEHCYLINMGVLTDKSPDYTPYSDTHKQSDEVRELVERLRRRPEVEVVSLSLSAYPYNGSNGSAEVDYDTLHAPRWTIRRIVTPDFVRVFRYQGARGETSEQLAEILERGDFLASDNLYRKYGVPMTSLVGKNEFHLFGDTTQTYRLGAALQNVRWDDYSQASTSYSMVYNMNLLPDDWINADNELCIRVRADRDQNFMENLKADSEKQFRIGNLYISDIKSFKDIRRSFQQGDTSQMRILVVGMGVPAAQHFPGTARHVLVPHAATARRDCPAQGDGRYGRCGVRPSDERRYFPVADRHRAGRRHRHRAGPLRTELLAQRHYAGVATPAVLRRRYVCPHRRHDRCWYRTSCPPCHEGAAGGGVAR